MSLNPLSYPVDYTGTATSNLVSGETPTLTTKAVRVFAPAQAPFFAKSLVIIDQATGHPLTTAQYIPYAMCTTASMISGSGNESYNVVAITDQSVSNNLTIDYQTVGGNYLMGADALVLLLNALTLDTRPVTWDNILNRPPAFPTNQHLESISATIGFEYVVEAIIRLATTIVLGDAVKLDEVTAYLDQALSSSNAVTSAMTAPGSVFGNHVLNTNNPHGVTPTIIGLGHVLNYAVAQLADVYAGTATNLYVTADQVASAVKNAINLGMDAHILRMDNPHAVTKAQIGLALLQNLTTAILTDLTSPDVNNPRYVTNVILASWLSSYFTTQQSTIAQAIATVSASAASALQAAQNAATQAQNAQSAATQATSQSGTAATQAAAALTQAQANALAVTNSSSAATALVQQYTTAAVSAADAAGFTRGFAQGQASVHS